MSPVRGVSLLAVLVLSAAVAVGCSAGETRSSGDDASSTRERVGGTIRFAMPQDPGTLDPAQAVLTENYVLQRGLFANLVRLDADQEPELDLAKSVELSGDRSLATITLRADAVWSDGSPITAEQVVASWRAAFASKEFSTARMAMPFIKGAAEVYEGKLRPEQLSVEADGPRTIRVTLGFPTSDFERVLSLPALAPRPDSAIEDPDAWWEQPGMLTSGPFTLGSSVKNIGSRIELVRNTRYWDAKRVDPDRIDISIREATHSVASAFLAGDIDAGMVQVDGDDVDRLDGKAKHFYAEMSPGTTFLVLVPQNQKALGDQRVREAISWAIDRSEITDGGVTSAAAVRATPPGLKGSEQVRDIEGEEDRDPSKPDATRARDLLGAAKAEGTPIRILAPYADSHVDEDNIAASLYAVGFDASVVVAPTPEEFDAEIAKPSGRAFDAYIYSEDTLTGSIDGLLVTQSCTWGYPFPVVCESEYDDVMRKVFGARTDEERLEHQRRAEELLTGPGGLFVQIPIYQISIPMVYGDHIAGDHAKTPQTLYLDRLRFANAAAAKR